MKPLTLKDAAQKTGISAQMLAAIASRVGTWAEYRGRIAKGVAEHGADAGWSGFVYYRETTEFFRKYSDEILTMLNAEANDYGITPAEMVAGFSCLSEQVDRDAIAAILAFGTRGVSDDDRATVYNALAWYALETVSRRLVECMEGE